MSDLTTEKIKEYQGDTEYQNFSIEQRYNALKKFKKDYIETKNQLIRRLNDLRRNLKTNYSEYTNLQNIKVKFPIKFCDELLNIIENDLEMDIKYPKIIDNKIINSIDKIDKNIIEKPINYHLQKGELDNVIKKCSIYLQLLKNIREEIKEIFKKWEQILRDFIKFADNREIFIDYLKNTPEEKKFKQMLNSIHDYNEYKDILENINNDIRINDIQTIDELKNYILKINDILDKYKNNMLEFQNDINEKINNKIKETDLEIINTLNTRIHGKQWREKDEIINKDRLKDIYEEIDRLPNLIIKKAMELLNDKTLHLWDIYRRIWYKIKDNIPYNEIVNEFGETILIKLKKLRAIDFEILKSYNIKL
ncbi:MAG: hypothetical protein ACTSVV_05400 [Promethearchaeota archaeon]